MSEFECPHCRKAITVELKPSTKNRWQDHSPPLARRHYSYSGTWLMLAAVFLMLGSMVMYLTPLLPQQEWLVAGCLMGSLPVAGILHLAGRHTRRRFLQDVDRVNDPDRSFLEPSASKYNRDL